MGKTILIFTFLLFTDFDLSACNKNSSKIININLAKKEDKMSINAMHVAKTGLNAQQVRMQIISNNLANVNTNGFKRDRANFESLLYQIIRSSGAQTSVDTELTSGFSVGTGVSIVNSINFILKDQLCQPIILLI